MKFVAKSQIVRLSWQEVSVISRGLMRKKQRRSAEMYREEKRRTERDLMLLGLTFTNLTRSSSSF